MQQSKNEANLSKFNSNERKNSYKIKYNKKIGSGCINHLDKNISLVDCIKKEMFAVVLKEAERPEMKKL